MTNRERSELRDRVARARLEPPPSAPLSERDEAGRAALAAIHEAERRHREKLSKRARRASARWRVPVEVVKKAPARDDDLIARRLRQLAASSPAAARVVAAMPPLEYIADDVDPVEHALGIIRLASGQIEAVQG